MQYTAHCSVEHNTTHSYDLGDVRTISTSMPTETSKEEGSCTFDFPSLANGPSNVPVVPPPDGVPTILTADPVYMRMFSSIVNAPPTIAVTESDPGSTLKLSRCPVRVCDRSCLTAGHAAGLEDRSLQTVDPVDPLEHMVGTLETCVILDGVGSSGTLGSVVCSLRILSLDANTSPGGLISKLLFGTFSGTF